MNRYRARQTSIKWFNAIIYVSGVIFNIFAFASIVNFITKAAKGPDWVARARVEMEDARRCSQHMADREFVRSGEQKVPIRLMNEHDFEITYKAHSTYGHTKDGHALEMADVRYSNEPGTTGLLFFIVNSKGRIEGCVSPYTYPINRSYQLDCLAAAGEYQSNGECHLPVQQPSDCRLMNGVLTQHTCVVPSGNRILRAGAGGYGRTCSTPDCES